MQVSYNDGNAGKLGKDGKDGNDGHAGKLGNDGNAGKVGKVGNAGNVCVAGNDCNAGNDQWCTHTALARADAAETWLLQNAHTHACISMRHRFMQYSSLKTC